MNAPPNATSTAGIGRTASRQFWIAFAINTLWINASEIWRYLAIIKPMLHEAFPGRTDIAPFTLTVFGLWSIWDTWLVFAATGFYWLYLNWAGRDFRHAMIAATLFTTTVFGLLWFGVANMGILPMRFFWHAMPLAWVEQAVAAMIVMWVMKKYTT
ncbi:MAG: hypothetical protein ACKVON_00975 [Beijerinckiaceae bacterium]